MDILITGASRGLGLALVSEGLVRGHTVVATCRGASRELESLRRAFPQRLVIQRMDVSEEASVESAARALKGRFASLDAVVNNAAVLLESKYFTGDPVTELPLGDVETTLDVNVMGPIRVLHYFAGFLYLSACPVILNVSSEGAMLKPQGSHYIAYSVSKYALNMYTQKIRNYFREKKPGLPVRVYMLHPGRMNTVMGAENAQIEAEVPARGILDILEGAIGAEEPSIPFIDYRGERMPDHYATQEQDRR